MFSRASPVIFTLPEDRAGISGVAVQDGVMWIMAARTAQKWAISSDTTKVRDSEARAELQFMADQDLLDVIGNGMFDDWSSGVDLTLNDIAPSG